MFTALKKNIQFFAFLSITIYCLLNVLVLVFSAFNFLYDIGIMLFFSWLVYFIFLPIVLVLEKKKISRVLAVLIIYSVLILTLILIITLAVPTIVSQLTQFMTSFPTYISSINEFILSTTKLLKIKTITNLDDVMNQFFQYILQSGNVMISNWLNIFSTTIATSIKIFIILFISSFMLIDEQRILSSIKNFIPQDYLDEMHLLQKRINKSFGGFLRGQLILGVTYGFFTWLVLSFLQVPFSFIAAIASLILMCIPFFNGFVSFIPGMLITAFARPDIFILVSVLLIAFNAVEINIIGNIVMGGAVGLHPILIIISILVGGKLGGVFGAIFAIPIAGVLAIIPEHWIQKRNADKKLMAKS